MCDVYKTCKYSVVIKSPVVSSFDSVMCVCVLLQLKSQLENLTSSPPLSISVPLCPSLPISVPPSLYLSILSILHLCNPFPLLSHSPSYHIPISGESCNSSSTVHYTGCHWCEFDNACHAVGDVIYGCAWGVNCYSIDNCQRMEPEPADAMSPPVGVTVLFVFVGLACCAGLTCCVFVSNRVKLAYLALLPEERVVGGGGEQEETTVVQRLFELKPFTSPFGGKKKRRSR